MDYSYKDLFLSSILSGFIISVVSYGYAVSNASILGSVLFAFGLMVIIFYGLHLFTGDAGFVQSEYDNEDLMTTLFGNVIGCAAGAALLSLTMNGDITPFITKALQVRETGNVTELLQVFFKAIFCGVILTISVKFAREAKETKDFIKILPLLLGVPLFLMCGFFHCIVDIFYIVYGMITTDFIRHGIEDGTDNYVGWFIVVIGNFVGCNLPRLIMWNKKF